MRRFLWSALHSLMDKVHVISFRLRGHAALRLYEIELSEEESRDA
jgi:hypothetical protein